MLFDVNIGDLIWVKTYPLGLRDFPDITRSNSSVMLHHEFILILDILEVGYYVALTDRGVLYVKEPLQNGNKIVAWPRNSWRKS